LAETGAGGGALAGTGLGAAGTLPDAAFAGAALVAELTAEFAAVLGVAPLAATSFALAALADTPAALSAGLAATFVTGLTAVFAGVADAGTCDLLGEADFIDSLTD
jgi:hypothetical protein